MFNQLAGMGSKSKIDDVMNVDWVDFAAANDQTTSLIKLLTRLQNIDFIHEQLTHMKIRFFSLTHPQNDNIDQSLLFKAAYEVLDETAQVFSYHSNLLEYHPVYFKQNGIHRLQ